MENERSLRWPDDPLAKEMSVYDGSRRQAMEALRRIVDLEAKAGRFAVVATLSFDRTPRHKSAKIIELEPAATGCAYFPLSGTTYSALYF
jgi:hypothetical protein